MLGRSIHTPASPCLPAPAAARAARPGGSQRGCGAGPRARSSQRHPPLWPTTCSPLACGANLPLPPQPPCPSASALRQGPLGKSCVPLPPAPPPQNTHTLGASDRGGSRVGVVNQRGWGGGRGGWAPRGREPESPERTLLGSEEASLTSSLNAFSRPEP